MLSAFHIFKDKDLLARVRHDLQQCTGDRPVRDIEPHQLEKGMPLLSSVYAETLRLYIKLHSVYSSPHEDVDLGTWKLPKGSPVILSSEPSHMDATFWNTQDGRHPVGSFWADRFIVDPSDPESGPVRPECRKPLVRPEKYEEMKPYFSTQGCEGAWIPYGGKLNSHPGCGHYLIHVADAHPRPGGYSICPGRFLAKNVVTFTSALLASQFDIEIYSESIEFTNRRYGMGVDELKHYIPFRIRRRRLS